MDSSSRNEEKTDPAPWRTAALVGGALFALVAFYLFYLRPWLGWSTPADGWLDQRHCLLPQLCTAQVPVPNQMGILAGLLALVLFWIALWPDGGVRRRTEAVTPWRVIAIALLAVFGTISVAVEAIQALSANQAPSPGLWFVAILAFGSISVLWDLPDIVLVARTASLLLIALGVSLILIGCGVAIAIPVNALWLLGAGVTAFLAGLFLTFRLAPGIRGKRPDRDHAEPSQASPRIRGGGGEYLTTIDFLFLLSLGLLALLLGVLRIDSWRYAFIGDEWGFYDLATTLIHRPELHSFFTVVDSNAYHTVFSSTLQAKVMKLAGENVYGWRLSSLLPLVLSVPAIYVFGHWLAGRTAAIVAGGLLASSHMLLSFSMVAYNNTQALVPLSLGLACFAFAQRRDSALRYYLLGTVLGSTFLVFGLARLTVLPIGILVLFFYWTTVQRAVKSMAFIIAGAVAVAAPLLFNLDNWRGLLKATPVQSEAVEKGLTLGTQLARNVVAGLTAFLVNDHNTHFVAGPHVDPLTAVLVLMGLAATVLAWRQRRPLAWLIASFTFWLAVSAIQQYEWVSTTRMFVLAPIYAVYAGVGAAALARLFFGQQRRHRTLFALALVILGVLLNQFHLVRVAHTQSHVRVESLLVREFQHSAAPDGSGIPVYIVWEQPYTLRENMILRAHEIEPGRIRFITADEALSMSALCDESRPQMLLVHADSPARESIENYVRNCWPIHEEMVLRNESDEARLYRFTTTAGIEKIVQPKQARPAQRPEPDHLAVPRPVDIAIDAEGSLFVLSSEPPAIWHFDDDGRLLGQLPLVQTEPSALTVTGDGLLLVASTDPEASLTWYDAGGRVVRSLAVAGTLGVPTALATGPAGELFVADAALGQVARLDVDGRLLGVLDGKGALTSPVALSAAGDGSLWVLDSKTGDWLKLSTDDEVLARWPAGHASANGAPQLVETDAGHLLVSQPENRRLMLLDVDRGLLDVWGGFHRPSAIAVDGDGRFYVVEQELDRISILPSTPIRTAGDIVVVRLVNSTDGDYGLSNTERPPGDFISPLSPLPLAQGMPVSAVVSQSVFALDGANGRLNRPRAIAAGIDPSDSSRYIYVGDADGGGLVIIEPASGVQIRAESASPPLQEVSDIAVDDGGQVYVLDSATGYLQRFSADGSFIESVSIDRGIVGDARGLDVDAFGDLWIADTRGGDIVKAGPDGRVLAQITVMPGQNSQPVDVAVDADGNLYVVEARTARLLHLTQDGHLLGAWSLSPFNTADASHLALDDDGNLYITQPEQGLVLVMSPDGELDTAWSVMHNGPGDRAKPVGIAVDSDGTVWVADVDGHSVVALGD